MPGIEVKLCFFLGQTLNSNMTLNKALFSCHSICIKLVITASTSKDILKMKRDRHLPCGLYHSLLDGAVVRDEVMT